MNERTDVYSDANFTYLTENQPAFISPKAQEIIVKAKQATSIREGDAFIGSAL